jgi:cobalamin biosynthesis Mg chelatase CobN
MSHIAPVPAQQAHPLCPVHSRCSLPLTSTPLPVPRPAGDVVPLTAETAEAVPSSSFSAYVGRLWQYLQVLENRLFSEGLHVLGQPPSEGQMGQYLAAYFGEDLPEAALAAVVEPGAGGLEEVRARLERSYMLQTGGDSRPAGEAHRWWLLALVWCGQCGRLRMRLRALQQSQWWRLALAHVHCSLSVPLLCHKRCRAVYLLRHACIALAASPPAHALSLHRAFLC